MKVGLLSSKVRYWSRLPEGSLSWPKHNSLALQPLWERDKFTTQIKSTLQRVMHRSTGGKAFYWETININVFWYMMPCNFVGASQRFRGTCCLLLQVLRYSLKMEAIDLPEKLIAIHKTTCHIQEDCNSNIHCSWEPGIQYGILFLHKT
jgi:hypothetical protein